MGEFHQPDLPRAALLGIGIVVLVLWRIIVWIRSAPSRPDPWDEETEQGVQNPEAVCVCHRCFAPVPPLGWFCEHCGGAVGPYNNWMPYIRVFSEGEILRNGVTNRLRSNALIIIGYLLLSLNYLILAPLYWFFFFKNLSRSRVEGASESRADQPKDGGVTGPL